MGEERPIEHDVDPRISALLLLDKLKEQRDRIQKMLERIDKQIEDQTEILRAYRRPDGG